MQSSPVKDEFAANEVRVCTQINDRSKYLLTVYSSLSITMLFSYCFFFLLFTAFRLSVKGILIVPRSKTAPNTF